MIVKKSMKIIGKWAFLIFRPETGDNEGKIIELHGVGPLSIQFGPEALGIFVPGSEIAAEGME